MNFKKLTAEEIERGRTKKGNFTRAQLANWGVKWPPARGWRERLMAGQNPNNPKRHYDPRQQHFGSAKTIAYELGGKLKTLTSSERAELFDYLKRKFHEAN